MGRLAGLAGAGDHAEPDQRAGRQHRIPDRGQNKLISIGTAGWNIPRQYAEEFSRAGSHLARYARVFPAVEINSSFYRPHKPSTYQRWAASVPAGFRFAVKMPKEITHQRKLIDAVAPLDAFLLQIAWLQDAQGPILIQLPPSLSFDAAVAMAFFGALRQRFDGDAVCEPRHASWFTDPAERVLHDFRIVRAAADPALIPAAAVPGGWERLIYRRLHGTPKIYDSEYTQDFIQTLAAQIRADHAPSWCIFDNTARGAAANNALQLMRRLALYSRPPVG